MHFLFQLFLFIVFINLANGKVFYIDDGEAQTVPVNLNNDRLNRLQAQILSLLGLRRPTSETETPDEVASRYMSSLYRSIEHRESVEFSPSFKYLENESKNLPFDFERISDWHTADTIISFVPKRIRILESGVETDINELEFDLSSDDVNADHTQLLNAELYFIADTSADNYSLAMNSIQLFTKGRESELVPVNYDRLTTGNEALFALNVTGLIDDWLRQPSEPKKLFARIKDVNGDNIINIEESKLHVFGVGFFTEDVANHFQRKKRSVDETVENDNDWAYSPNSLSNRVNVFETPKTTSSDNGRRRCKRRSLYVDFKDLGWHSWVIAPNGYQADYCDGFCEFPLDNSVNPTNHAIVQTMVHHLVDGKRTSEAKCAPTAMNRSPLRILFYNNKKVIIKGYHDMQVRECGCQ